MAQFNIINSDFCCGTLSIRETEKLQIVHIVIGSDEFTHNYNRDETMEYILEDLDLYHGYKVATDTKSWSERVELQ